MGSLRTAYPSAALYNAIPFIHDMEYVAQAHADDLTSLRNLLIKYDLPTSVCVKLLHIHFHLNQGEILTVHELDASPYGKIPFLEPVPRDRVGKVYGCSYVVDDQGDLQAFEYTEASGGPDLRAYPEFIEEFCALIVRRGLQRKFGLAINSGVAEDGAWVELDYPEKRATFLLPETVPVPTSEHLEVRVTTTKFPRPDMNSAKKKTHAHVEHSWSRKKNSSDGDVTDGVTTIGGLHLTGVALEPGTPFHRVVSAISAAA